MADQMADQIKYTDDNIITLEGVQHIRMRPGMYIGRLGNGNNPGDGIYVLLKEVVDNCIDEFATRSRKARSASGTSAAASRSTRW